MIQEGPHPLFPIPAYSGVLAALQGRACLAVDLVPALDDGAVEGAKAGSLHDAADAHEGEDEGHKGEVGELYGPGVGRPSALALGLAAPSLPVLPRRVVARVGGPAPPIELPLGGGGRTVVAGPAVAPEIVRLSLLHIREDIVGRNKHAVALEAHVQRQRRYWRGGVASVGVV